MSGPDDKSDDDKRPKKERVLHTRVPAVLEQELKRLANAWRVPVSNVVRTILEDALDTVEVVSRKAEGELRGVAQRLATERGRLRAKSSGPITRIQSLAGDGHAEALVGRDERDPDNPLDGAVGFTPIILANDAVCALTGAALKRGADALLVLFEEPGRQEIVGRDALPFQKEEE